MKDLLDFQALGPKLFYFLLFAFLFNSSGLLGQKVSKSENQVRAIMAKQEQAWNAGDIEGFMNGYWESDSLKFIGKRGLTYGWEQTLANYKKSYPDRAAMGKLTFTLLHVSPIGKKSIHVIGKWHLQREADELQGHFTLVWKKIKGGWVIVSDHSS